MHLVALGSSLLLIGFSEWTKATHPKVLIGRSVMNLIGGYDSSKWARKILDRSPFIR